MSSRWTTVALTVVVLSVLASAFRSSETALFRRRRQIGVTIYVCGSYPNQYTSYSPCSYSAPSCYVSCTSDYICMMFGMNMCASGCCTTVTTYYPTIVNPQYNPSIISPPATQTQQCIGPCVNGQCPDGYFCNANNVCCKFSS
ncbi:hypothetical protein Q1695_006359 [Nippostrongylus brasiliensis]|nr:hypothetical protein Q1695_006359 [Nippostrongylus brasiliensis]